MAMSFHAKYGSCKLRFLTYKPLSRFTLFGEKRTVWKVQV